MEYCWVASGSKISCLNNIIFKTILYLLGFATTIVGTPFSPLLSQLHQFINAYTKRRDIRGLMYIIIIEASVLISFLLNILILNLRITTVHFWSNSSVFAMRYT